ncbi:MAG TPA: nucleotidyltransferase family protein [Pyrinomonadaceae bacterium]
MSDSTDFQDPRPKTKGPSSDQRSKTKGQSSVAAILLAAGRSERMGTFKPLLPFGEKTVIEACLDYLRKGGIETIVVVGGHRIDKLRDRLKTMETGRGGDTGTGSFRIPPSPRPPIILVENPDPSSEMGHSIACGIKAVPENFGAVLIGLVDHPAVSPQVVQQLIDEWKRGTPLVVPTWQGRGGHPVLVDLRFRPDLLNLPPEGGLKSLFLKHGEHLRRLPVDSPFIARDIDTWDDYTRLHLDVFGVKPTIQDETNERPHRTI